MKTPYFFVRFFGTFAGEINAYLFCYSQKVTGKLPYLDFEDLTAEEIGQELGGN